MVLDMKTQDSNSQEKNFFYLINQIQRVHFGHPQLRLGQLLSIAASRGGWESDDLFYVPDDTLSKGLMKM